MGNRFIRSKLFSEYLFMRNATRCFGWILCLCAFLLTAGCGGKGAVSGKVLYQGKPVRAGTVSFVLEGGGVVSSLIGEDGSYTIQNVPPGTVKITVETASARPLFVQDSGQERRGQKKAPDSEAPEFMMKYSKEKDSRVAERGQRYVPIPEQYSDPAKSNLTYVVKSGKQEHDIDLK
jgi:hypothetical protein